MCYGKHVSKFSDGKCLIFVKHDFYAVANGLTQRGCMQYCTLKCYREARRQYFRQ